MAETKSRKSNTKSKTTESFISRVTTCEEFDRKNMRFEIEPFKKDSIVKKITPYIVSEDGTKSDLILRTAECYSYGFSENVNFKKPDIKEIGYQIGICLEGKGGEQTPEQTEFIRVLGEVTKQSVDFVLENKEALFYDLDMAHCKKASPIYQKRDDKGVITGTRTLYTKLLVAVKGDYAKVKEEKEPNRNVTVLTTILQRVGGPDSTKVKKVKNIHDFIGVRFNCISLIKIDAITVRNNSVKVQAKLYEILICKTFGGNNPSIFGATEFTIVDDDDPKGVLLENDENGQDSKRRGSITVDSPKSSPRRSPKKAKSSPKSSPKGSPKSSPRSSPRVSPSKKNKKEKTDKNRKARTKVVVADD